MNSFTFDMKLLFLRSKLLTSRMEG